MGFSALSYSLHHIHKAGRDGEREEQVRGEESQCQQQSSRLGTHLGRRQLASRFHSGNWLRLMQNCFHFGAEKSQAWIPKSPGVTTSSRERQTQVPGGRRRALWQPPWTPSQEGCGIEQKRALHVGKNKVWHVLKAKSQQAMMGESWFSRNR